MPEEKRLTIAARPAEPGVMCVTKNFYPSAFLNDFSRMDTPAVFNNVFFFQWLTSVSPRDIHYLELVIPQSEGIGCILATCVLPSFTVKVNASLLVKSRPDMDLEPSSVISPLAA